MKILPNESEAQFCTRCEKKLIKNGRKPEDAIEACKAYYYSVTNETQIAGKKKGSSCT